MSEKRFENQEDGYGFVRPNDFDHTVYNEFTSSYLPVLTRRASRWQQVVGNKATVTKSATVKRFCRKGIPSAERPTAWLHLSGAYDRMKSNPHLFQQMLDMEHNKELVDTINMDIHRTFPDNKHFADTRAATNLRKPLFNILIAIGHRNRTIGYCQGMNFVVGLLLLVMKSEDNYEEKVFWLMDTLINNILPDYYHPDMHAVKLDQEVLGELVRWKAPDIYHHLETQGLSWCLIGMKWFICLFADVLPVDTVLRIWDCLFYEGPKILMRASLVIVLNNKDRILKTTDFSQVTDLFKETVVGQESLHCHQFLNSMFKSIGSLPTARINKIRRLCESKVS
ncbi:growth hormone-regulated TBC protein 1-A-like [Ruditapes philippinarum]|uniref:growth hormone-regulated TBC protein 1-A-like n=1 Tax=Ruditapes philippinarum TaxID=129788 RepID=UPI00295B4339|nr:growth hormone-regulated TBC protein 1-A-like [Ruditapes philippinarum]